MSVSQICEIAMLCLFGCSWPFNIAKALRVKTAKGKSIWFEVLVLIGVLAYSVWFYLADLLMVAADMIIYCVNTRRDRLAEAAAHSSPRA